MKINFKNSELLKSISDQFKLLSWAIAGIYYYLGIGTNKIFTGISICVGWAFIQIVAHWFLLKSQQYRKE